MYHVLLAIDHANKDVIHRSLHLAYPHYFIQLHNWFLSKHEYMKVDRVLYSHPCIRITLQLDA